MGSDSTSKAETSAPALKFKAADGINLHKLLCGPAIYGLMLWYNCFTTAAWIYLALHTSYGLLWLFKEAVFPDKTFQVPTAAGEAIGAFVFCDVCYWATPWILVKHAKDPPSSYLCACTMVFVLGFFLMMGADCQKYYMLKYAPGKLIRNGFFKYVRNPNYLGEILIYASYSALTYTPWGIIPTLVAFSMLWVPNMIKKDKSMSRYPDFAEWKLSSYFIFPPIY